MVNQEPHNIAAGQILKKLAREDKNYASLTSSGLSTAIWLIRPSGAK